MIFRDYALREDGDEPGAKTSRLKRSASMKKKGSATGYIVKYICKNIDGNFSEDGNQAEDWFGNDARDASERVGAWAAIHRIRQFQQIGGAPVTVWRELRRLEPVSNELVDSARQAADQSDWATFVELMGGPVRSAPRCPFELPIGLSLIQTPVSTLTPQRTNMEMIHQENYSGFKRTGPTG